MIRKSLVAALALATVALTAAPAAAADSRLFWNGVDSSGQCGTPVLLGSQKVDDPAVSGIQQAGTIQKYRATCSYPTSANQTCWWTRGKRIDGGVMKTGITWINGGAQYWLSDNGADWQSSPMICEHMVDGTSWGAWASIGGLNATLYT
jgi:hypothetical protein